MKTKFSPDICVRWIIATAKVTVLFGLLLFLLSCCSCSSARKADQMTASSSDTISVVSSECNSVGVKASESSWFSQIIRISGLDIIIPELAQCSIPDTVDMVSTPPKASPSNIHIDELEIAASSGKDVSSAKDSVSSSSKAESAASGSKSSEVKIRSPDFTKWQALLMLAFVLLVIAFTGYNIYCSNSPQDQSSLNA